MSKVFCVLRNKAFKQKAKQLDISEAALDRIVFNYINQVGNADAFPPDNYIMSEYSPVNVVSREDLPYALDVWNQLFSEDQTFLSIQEAMDAMAEAQQYFKEEAAVIQPLYNGQYKVIVGKPQLPTKVPSSKVLFQKTLENQRYILASVKHPFKSWSRNINGQLALLKRKGVDDVILEQFRLALSQDPKNANLTPAALFNKIVQQKVDYIEQAYQEYFNLKAIPALEQHLENFLKKYNFEIRREDMSTLFEDGVLGAIDLLNKVIYVAKEGRNAITFPEEFAHAFVELMGAVHKSSYSKDYPTFKDYSFLFDSVEHTAIYKRVFEQYKTTYLNEQGDPDIETIKKEAIGQALAAAIVDNWKAQHEPEEKGFWAALKRFFNAILNTFKDAEYFSFDTLINKMADEIVKGDYSRLEKLDATDYSLVEYSETIRSQNSIDNGLAFGMIKDFSDSGGIITGSLSYRAQGRVYRGQMDGLHDIDMIIPQSVHGIDLNSEELKNALAACSYRNMQPLKEYLLKHDYFKQIEAKYSKALSASEQEMMDIKKKAQANGTFMLAPNGKPTNLTERQWLQVRTKAFKAWFGDWERYAPKNARNNLISTDGDINWEYFESLMANYHNGQPDSMFSKGRYTLATRPEKHFEGEGNTLNHIKFVTQTMLDLFEGKYDMDLPFVSEARASLKNQKDLMVLAAMFHDAAKPYRHGDIHGWESADILRDVIGIDYNNRLAEWAIRHHMAMPFSHKADFVASNPEAVEVAKNMARDAMRVGIDAQTAINAFVLINSADIINNRDISVEDNWAKKAQVQGINRYGEDISVKNVLSIELNEKVALLKQAFEAVKDEDFGDTAYNYANQERFDYAAFPEGGRQDKKLPFLHNNENNGASKVVDKNGEPLVVYHGSDSKEIQAFDLSTPNLRAFTGTLNKKFYFMDSKKDALSYINEKYETLAYAMQRYETAGVDWEEVLGPDSDKDDLIKWYAKELDVSVEDILKARELMNQYGDVVKRSEDFEDYLYPVFLNLRNPVIIDANGRQIIDLADEEKKAVNGAQDVIIKRVNEAVYSSYVEQIVDDFLTDNPNNIKSAVSNSGEFSIQNNDIYDPIDYQGSAFNFFNVIANSTDDYITVSAVYSPYNPELARRFMSLEGSYSDRLDKFTDKERQQIYLFDFFLKPNDSTPYITTDDGVRMSTYQTSFVEKLKMGRAKDVFDYQRWKTYDAYKSKKLSSKVMYQKQIQYNKEQQEAIDKMAQHIQDVLQGKTDQRFFTLQGKAGTGKTTCIDGLIKKYREQTGKILYPTVIGGAISWEATNNLRRKVSNPGRTNLEFCSLASMLGMVENSDGEFIEAEGRKKLIENANLVIIDECSQINEDQFELIKQIANTNNIPVIFAGDPGQTPPIRKENSPIPEDTLSPTFTDTSIPRVQLKTRVRQGEQSPLLDYADKYWNYAMGLSDEFPTNEDMKSIINDNGALIFQRDSIDIVAQTEQLWHEARGTDDNPIGNPYLVRIVPFRTDPNKAKKATTLIYNDRVRELFYGDKKVSSQQILEGDSIVFTANYNDHISNSTLAKINSISEPEEYTPAEIFDNQEIQRLIEEGEINPLNLAPVLMQTAVITFINSEGKTQQTLIKLLVPTTTNIRNYENNRSIIYNTFKPFYGSKDRSIRNLAFLWKNYRDGLGQVQFSHSIGVHKAQGSTYDISIVDVNDIMQANPKEISLRTKARAIYTALTRASNVTIVITDDTNEDTIYTDIKAINDRINQAKKGQAEGKFVPATEKAYYGSKVTKTEAKKRVKNSNTSKSASSENVFLTPEQIQTLQGDSAGKVSRKVTTAKKEGTTKVKFVSKKQESTYNEVINMLEEASSHIEFFGEGTDHYYKVDGVTNHLSVSEFASFLLTGEKKKDYGVWGLPANTLGTGVDDILRDYFMGKVKKQYPNFTEKQLDDFINKSIVKFKKELERIFGKGYIAITDPDILKVAANVEYKGQKYLVAGTMDMLVIDSKGRVNVVDFKTKRANKDNDYDTEKIDQYTVQTSLYMNFLNIDKSKRGINVIAQFNHYYPNASLVDYARNDKIDKGKYKGVLLFREKNKKGNYYPITEISSYQDKKGREFEYSAQDLVRDRNVGYRAAEFYEMDETKWYKLSPEDMSIQITPYVPGTTVLAQNKQTARSTRKKSVNQEKATKTGQGVNNFAKYKNSSVQSEDFFTAVRDGEITAITKALNGDYFASLKVGDVLELHNQNKTKSVLVRVTKVNDDDTLAGFSDAEWSNWDARNGISEQYYNEILDGNNNTLAEFQFEYVEGSYSEEGEEESQPEATTQSTVKRQTTTEPSTTGETATQINTKKATRGASATMDMYYNGNQRDEVTSKSTLMAIVNGERTATTRHKHIEFWKKWKRGDIVELHDKAGRSILVRITKAAKALPKNISKAAIASWSKKEGWSKEYFEEKILPLLKEGQEVVQIEFQYVKDSYLSDKKLEAPKSEVQKGTRKTSAKSTTATKDFDSHFTESRGGYPVRTDENAEWSDITLGMGIDFTTNGEFRTAEAAGAIVDRNKKTIKPAGKYLQMEFDIGTPQNEGELIPNYSALDKVVSKAKKLGKPIKLNIGGNGIYTFKDSTQEDVNEGVLAALKYLIDKGVQIEEVRSGGQSGVDEAGILAAQSLDLPWSVHAPKGWQFLDANKKSVYGEEKFKARFMNSSQKAATNRKSAQSQESSDLDDLEWTKVGDRQIAIIDADYTKETPIDNPDTDFVFTENAQAAAVVYNDTDEQQRLDDEYELWYPGDESNMFGLKLNVTSKGNQSGIRMSDDSTFNSNAYGVVVKKFQQNQQGKFVMEEGFFHDTPEDRAMFEAYNKRFFDLLDASNNEYIVFPQQMALGKSGLPLEFAKWLKSELESRYNLVCEIAPAKVNGFFGLKIQGVGETVQEDEMEFVLKQRKVREAELESARPLATYKSEFFDLEFSNDENKFYTQIATVKPVMDSDTLGNTVRDQVKQLLASLPMSALIQIDSSEIHANTVLLIEALLKDKSAHMIPGEGTEVVLDPDSQAYEFAKNSKYKDLPFDKNTGTLTIPKFTLGYTQQEIKERQEMDELLDSDLFTASELRDLSKSAIFRLSAVISELQADSNTWDKYFPNKEKVDLTGMSRVELIREVGLGNLLAAVRDVFFDFESENSEVSLDIPFEVLDKMEFIKNHWQSFIQLGYDVLARAESIAFDNKHNVKDIDYVSSYYNYTGGQTEEEIAEFYGDSLESWQVGFRSVGAFSSLSQLIKNTFYQVYKVDEQGNPILNEFGLKESISPQELVATLLYFLKDCRTMSQMITALEERQEDTPWVGQILDKLSSSDEQFKSQFYTNFRKYFQKYAIVYMKKGVPTLKVINEKESIEQQLAEFKAKNAVYEQGDFHLRNQDGTVSKISLRELGKVQKALSSYNSRFTDSKYRGDKFQQRFTETELKDIETQVLQLLDILNLEVPEKVMLRKALFNIERFKKLRDSLGAKGGLLETLKNWSEKGITAWEEQGEEYNNFIQDVTNVLNIVFYEKDIQLDSVSYQHGKMHYSYVLPSYLSRTISSLSQEGLTAQEYGEFMKNQFRQYGFFYTEGKAGKEGKYRLGWLERLKDPKARKALKHIVSLDHLGKEYKEKSPCEYYSSLLSHYLYSNDLAYFRVPILGNKPSEEYIRFEKITNNYETVITDWLFETLKQEADRIRAVKQRAEYAKKHPEIKIKNFDGKNGLRFNFLDFMQPYYDGTYKNTQEYQEANSDTRKELDKFAKILNTYVDNTRKLTTDQQTQFPELFADVLRLCMENRFKVALKDYEDVGFVSRRNGFKVLDHKGVTEGLLREFFWNDFYASINITQILLTDTAYYKNTEDLQKRLPQVHAPGRMANIEALDIWDENDPNAEIRKYTDGYERTMYLKDRIDKADILINLDKALNNIERTIKDKEELAGFRELRKFILTTFSKVNMTDAQGYSCPTSYRKKLAIFGDWTKEMETLYRKLISNEAMTGEDIAQAINVLWEPLKPFVYSQIPKPGYNSVLPTIKVGVQNKNSEYVLLLAEAIMRKGNQPNKLSAIYKFMEDSQRDENGRPTGKGIDTIQFESTVKTGLMGVIDINGLTTEEEVYNALQTAAGYDRDTDSYSKDYVHEIPFDDYIIQQNVPSHFRKHSQGEGSQVRILSISDIPFLGENGQPNTISFDFGIDGEGKPQQYTMTVQEAVEEYCALHAENIEESGQEVLRRFNIQAVDSRARNIALSRVLKQAILKDGRLGADMLWACDTNKFGEFNVPLSDPIHCSRIQQLLNSIIKNDINKQKVAGGPLVQVTSFGTSDDLQVRYKTTSGQILLTEKEFYSKSMPTDYGTNSYKNPQGYDTYEEYIEDQAGVAYFEAYVPIWDEDLIKDFSTTDAQGNTVIDVEAIRQKYPKMLEMMGYRIPTESKYSMVPIRVKGFLPVNSEGIMLPAEITSFSGSDFDVDKLYVMLYKFKRVVKKMGKNSVVTYEEVTEGRDGRNNKILSIARALLASPYTARQFSTPGNFEAPKKLGYLISYVQQSDKVTVDSYNEAKGKDVDTLKDLNYKSKNLLFNNVQVQFHTQNMVAAQLIGVFALANVSHAFISLYNERCRANNSDSNKKPMEPAKIHIPNGYEFTLDGYEMSGDVIIDDMMTLDRRDMISSNLAALLASSVDAVKDPILNLININMDTVNPIIALLRLGFNLEQVSLLCSQPIIRKVINEFNVRKAQAGKNKKVYLSTVISDQLSTLCDKDDRLKGIHKIDLSSEDLIANLVDQNTPTSRQVAYATLKLWERAIEIAKTFRNITHMTSYNSISSAVGPFAYNTAMLREKQNAYKRDSTILKGTRAAINNPILLSFMKVADNVEQLVLGGNMAQASDSFNETFSILSEALGGYMEESTAREFTDFYMAYFTNNGPTGRVFDLSADNRAALLYDFPKWFAIHKHEFEDNAFIRAIRYTEDDQNELPYLKLETRRYSYEQVEDLKRAWAQLFKEGGTRRDLAIFLAEYCFFRGTFGFNPMTFINLLPSTIKLGLPGYVENLQDPSRKLTENQKMAIVIQFLLHHKELLGRDFGAFSYYKKQVIQDLGNGRYKMSMVDPNGPKDRSLTLKPGAGNLVTVFSGIPYLKVEEDPIAHTVTLQRVNFLGGEGLGIEVSTDELVPETVFASGTEADNFTGLSEEEFSNPAYNLSEKQREERLMRQTFARIYEEVKSGSSKRGSNKVIITSELTEKDAFKIVKQVISKADVGESLTTQEVQDRAKELYEETLKTKKEINSCG